MCSHYPIAATGVLLLLAFPAASFLLSQLCFLTPLQGRLLCVTSLDTCPGILVKLGGWQGAHPSNLMEFTRAACLTSDVPGTSQEPVTLRILLS